MANCIYLSLLIVLFSAAVRSRPDADCVLTELQQRLKDAIESLSRCLPTLPETSESTTKTSNVGTVYVRWGRTTCAGDAKVVYRGQAGASHYTHPGSGANMLCLHSDPQYANYPGNADIVGRIYGVEYELIPERGSPFSTSSNSGQPLYNNDMPCVVCHVRRTATVMIPSRRDCPDGWTREYNGYLVSQYDVEGRHRSSFDCMDDAPETIPGGYADNNQGVVYPVLGMCGSIQCADGKYVDGRQLTCVVCTK